MYTHRRLTMVGILEKLVCRLLTLRSSSTSLLQYRSFSISGFCGGNNNQSRKFIPRRAMLYIPGDSHGKILKGANSLADSLILNCEDGVSLDRKQAARETVRDCLDSVNFGLSECCVRVNSIQSGLVKEDLDVILDAKKTPSTFLIPKVDSFQEIAEFVKIFFNEIKENKKKVATESINVLLYTESAMGLLNLRDICKQFLENLDDSYFFLDGIIFGSDDYCADIGATRSEDGDELIVARQQVVTIAKAFRVHAIDMVHIDLHDQERLEKTSVHSAAMGFSGRQAIHPGQIPIIQRAFTPSIEKVEWATSLVEAYEKHQLSGEGVFTFRGSMIDAPLYKQAKNVVTLMARLNRRYEALHPDDRTNKKPESSSNK